MIYYCYYTLLSQVFVKHTGKEQLWTFPNVLHIVSYILHHLRIFTYALIALKTEFERSSYSHDRLLSRLTVETLNTIQSLNYISYPFQYLLWLERSMKKRDEK